MRFFEFNSSNLLSEIKMKPQRLAKGASRTGAIAGMEFEMIIPFHSINDEELSADYAEDQAVEDFDDIYDFFMTNNANSRAQIDSVISRLRDEWHSWANRIIDPIWKDQGFEYYKDFVREELYSRKKYANEIKSRALELSGDPQSYSIRYMIDHIWDTLVRYEYEYHEDYNQWIMDAEDEVIEQLAKEYWAKDFRVDEVRDIFNNHIYKTGPYTKEYWLGEHYPFMSDIESMFNLDWPFTRPSVPTIDFEAISDSFAQSIGKRVIYGRAYHQVPRGQNAYIIEPDSSLAPHDSNSEIGLEFVSPAMPFDELLEDMANVISWADSYGAYTNESCGLHMNVSIPGKSNSSLDYVKLAILLGDEYILNQFGRLYSEYAKSSIKTVKNYINELERSKVDQLLTQLKSNFDRESASIIHNGLTVKYSSINIKHDTDSSWYVEFRSPGGDWLNTPIDQLTQTLHRFIVVLDAATDPNKYHNEYIKKLYQLLPKTKDVDLVDFFVKYSTGQWDLAKLKNTLSTHLSNIGRQLPQK